MDRKPILQLRLGSQEQKLLWGGAWVGIIQKGRDGMCEET